MTAVRRCTKEAALRVNVALRVRAERLIAAYVSPESDRAAIINELITLFDGPAQREAQRLASEAFGEDFGNNARTAPPATHHRAAIELIQA